MSALGDAHHFLIGYAQGYGSNWNAGKCCENKNPQDDLTYLDQMVGVIRHEYPRASPQLRVVGFSTGGMMAYTYACNRPQVAGAAAVAGAWVSANPCNRQGLRIYHIHGVEDQYVPYLGGYSPLVGYTFEPVLLLHGHFPAHTQFHLHTVPAGIHAWPDFAPSEIWDWLR